MSKLKNEMIKPSTEQIEQLDMKDKEKQLFKGSIFSSSFFLKFSNLFKASWNVIVSSIFVFIISSTISSFFTDSRSR